MKASYSHRFSVSLSTTIVALCLSQTVSADEGVVSMPRAIALEGNSSAASLPSSDCRACSMPSGSDSPVPTTDVLAIFSAARAVDEATFSALIARTPDINRCQVDDQTLIYALLWPTPPKSALAQPSAADRREMTDEDRARLLAEHRATLPRRTRMLAMALQHGVDPNAVTDRGRLPGLHLAMLFGTPEMVDMLLRAGANPNLSAGTFQKLPPIAHTLHSEYAVRMTGLPDLVSRRERADMFLALIKAGAERPFADRDRRMQGSGGNPTAFIGTANNMLWEPLVEMTEGSAVLDAFVALGSPPPPVTASGSLLARAAYAGNVDAVAWLQKHLPRYNERSATDEGTGRRDTWSEAAAWALETPFKEKRLPLLKLLVNTKTNWSSVENQTFNEHYLFGLTSNNRKRSFGRSLLARTVATGDIKLVELAISLDAVRRSETGHPSHRSATDNGSGSPAGDALVQALLMQRSDLLQRLLAAGASPLAQASNHTTPLAVAVNPDAAAPNWGTKPLSKESRLFFTNSLDTFLKTLTPAQIHAADTPERTPLLGALDPAMASDGPALVTKLVNAGFSLGNLPVRHLVMALKRDNTPMALAMLDAGIGKARSTTTASNGMSEDDDDFATAIAIAAIGPRQPVLDRLLALRPPGAAMTPAQLQGMSALAAGGHIDAMKLLHSRGWAIDRRMILPAMNSMHPAVIDFVLKTTGSSIDTLCIPSEALYDGLPLVNALYRLEEAEWQQLLSLGIARLKSCPEVPSEPTLLQRKETSVITSPIPPRPMTLIAIAILSDPFATVGKRKTTLPARIVELRAQGMEKPDSDDEALTQVRAQTADDPRLKELLVALDILRLPQPSNQRKTAAQLHPTSFVGYWRPAHNGEVASQLNLRADGRFEWALNYGATDENAQGNWYAEEGRIVLTSDPVKPFNWFKVTDQSQYADGPELGQPFTVKVDAGRSRLLNGVRAELHTDADEAIYLNIEPGTDKTVKSRGQPKILALWFMEMRSAVATEVTLPALPRLKSLTLSLQLPDQAVTSRFNQTMDVGADGLHVGSTVFKKVE